MAAEYACIGIIIPADAGTGAVEYSLPAGSAETGSACEEIIVCEFGPIIGERFNVILGMIRPCTNGHFLPDW